MNTIITIGRQIGSGGRLIGRILAERLGLAFYDQEILKRAASESGIKDEFFETHDERNTLLSRITNYFSMSTYGNQSCLTSEGLFKIQSDAIRKAAEEGGAVFVGRCSDYILRDFPNRTDVFITADINDRVTRAQEYFHTDAETALNKIEELESARAEYYNFFTNKTWGAAASYELCLNSSRLTLEECADTIIRFIEQKRANANK